MTNEVQVIELIRACTGNLPRFSVANAQPAPQTVVSPNFMPRKSMHNMKGNRRQRAPVFIYL